MFCATLFLYHSNVAVNESESASFVVYVQFKSFVVFGEDGEIAIVSTVGAVFWTVKQYVLEVPLLFDVSFAQ